MASTSRVDKCTHRTLFNDLIVGNEDTLQPGSCSEHLTISSFAPNDTDGIGLDAMNKSITTFAVHQLPDNVTWLWLFDNQLTEIPVFTAKNLKKINLRCNLIASLENVHVPPSITTLGVSENQLVRVVNYTLPPNLQELFLYKNHITHFKGVRFPATLKLLNLSGNPIDEFEIAKSDVVVIKDLDTFEASASQQTCENVYAQLQLIRGVNVCVVPDEEWISLYRPYGTAPSSKAPSPTIPSSSSSSTTTTTTSSSSNITWIIVTAGVAVAVIAVILLLIYRSRRQQALSPSLAEPFDLERPPTPKPASRRPYYALNSLTVTSSSDQTAMQSPVSKSHEAMLLCDPDVVAVRLPSHLLEVDKIIGRGAFGEVLKGTFNGRTVAIKRLCEQPTAAASNIQPLQSLISEVRLITRLSHPNLVELIGVAWDSDSLVDFRVVYEFMSGGDLRRTLMEFDSSGHPKGFDKEKVCIALDVVNGLKYLHNQSPKVYHRDLKSRNILLDNNLRAKLSDFGSSRRTSDHTMTMTAGMGTNLWMAPEMLMGHRYDEKADIFSFGVVLSELDTHLLPYAEAMERKSGSHAVGEFAILQQVAFGKTRVSFTHPSQEDLVVAVANACVNVNPQDRPSAAEVVSRLEMILGRLKR